MSGTCLVVVAEDEHGDASAQCAEPLNQHLRELVHVLVGKRCEEVPPQEVEHDAASHGVNSRVD
jgi:hypothetical protein